jgi:3-oxoadipate enol-lactonase
MEVKVNNGTMPFLRMGSGEPLVLIHGLSECKEGWNKQFELAEQYELFIPDLRGHGNNHTMNGITIENFARDVIALLDLHNIESAHICGYSLGGIVAQEIYRQAPKRCKSLVFACTTPYFFNQFGRIIGNFAKIRLHILTPNIRKIIAARVCFYSWNDENFKNFEKCLKPNYEGMCKTIDAVVEVDNRSLLAEIKVPTLVIAAQYDTVIPVIIPIYMHKQIPNSELVVLKNAGHFAKIELAKEFNQALLQFLSKYPKASKVS